MCCPAANFPTLPTHTRALHPAQTHTACTLRTPPQAHALVVRLLPAVFACLFPLTLIANYGADVASLLTGPVIGPSLQVG